MSTVKQIAGHSISERNGIGNSNCFYKDVGLLLPLEKVLSIVYSATSDLMKVNQPVSSQSMVDNMKTNGHLLLATQWSSVLGGMASAEDLREELQEKLVEKIVLSTSNDLELLFAHISCIPVDRVFSFLYELRNKVGSNYKALTSLTYCASGVATLHGNDMLLELLQKAKTAALWGYQLSSLNVDCQAAIDGSPEDQLALVRQFQKIPDLSVEFLRRYCDDFQLDFDEAVLLLMESFLLSLVEEDASLIGEKPTLGRLKRILDSALPRRWNRLNACRFLDILKKLDPYNYDGIQFILSRLEVPDIQHYFEIFR